jgi:Sulfotransferase domain
MAVSLPPSQQRNIEFFNTLFGGLGGLPPPYTRKIDLVDGRREIPMKVLCLGYSRTGTLSMYTALQMLGYKPYHMAEAIKNARVDLECWVEGVEAKMQGKGKEWGREEFDKLTGRCDVCRSVVDWIWCGANLLAGYPGYSEYSVRGGDDCGVPGCEGDFDGATGGR